MRPHATETSAVRRRLAAALVLSLLAAAAVGSEISARQKPPEPKLKRGMYFRTLPSGARLPRADAPCTRLVTRRAWEPRPDNYAANHTVPSGRVSWPSTRDQLHWRRWIAKRSRVSGRYKGRTDQIIRWGACKWGLDENLLRAVAVQESGWHQSTVGDNGGSFGLMQVKDHYSDGTLDLGGYPWTQRSTAVSVDVYGAWIRACLNGDFYDGSDWLYGGQRMSRIIAAHGLGYALWGCVGAWFSGDWYSGGAQSYIGDVKQYLADKAWRHLAH